MARMCHVVLLQCCWVAAEGFCGPYYCMYVYIYVYIYIYIYGGVRMCDGFWHTDIEFEQT